MWLWFFGGPAGTHTLMNSEQQCYKREETTPITRRRPTTRNLGANSWEKFHDDNVSFTIVVYCLLWGDILTEQVTDKVSFWKKSSASLELG